MRPSFALPLMPPAVLFDPLTGSHPCAARTVLPERRYRAARGGAGIWFTDRTIKKETPPDAVFPLLAGPVSRVLCPGDARVPVIYLRRQSPAASSNLPPGIGRATLNCRYTRSCNPRDVRPEDIAASAVGSYPAFSPLPAGITKIPCGRSFSVTLPYALAYQVVSLRGALCCPDFPLPACGRQRQGGPAGQRYPNMHEK